MFSYSISSAYTYINFNTKVVVFLITGHFSFSQNQFSDLLVTSMPNFRLSWTTRAHC